MRKNLRLLTLCLMVNALLTLPMRGFEPLPPAPTITHVQVGFKPVGESDPSMGAFKPFFWTPVLVEIKGGVIDTDGELVLEAEDADGVGTVTKIPVHIPKDKATKALGYVKTALGSQRGGEPIKVSVRIGDVILRPPQPLPALGLPANKRLCVVIGQNIPALEQLITLAREEGDTRPDQSLREFQSWHLAAIDTSDAMPDRWYGYEAADVVILGPGKEYLAKFGPLADWVRRGGRLIMVVGTAKEPEPQPFPILTGQPARIESLAQSIDNSIQEWSLASLFPDALTVAQLPRADSQPWFADNRALADEWVRFAASKSSPVIPLVSRVSCGFGSVTYVNLPLERIAIAARDTLRIESATFFRQLLGRVAGQSTRPEASGEVKKLPYQVELSDQLDRFDVRALSFGWIATLILMFLLLVGPIEHFVLRKIGSSALTWITYPAVIAGMCIFGYYFAPRYKGTELRINQVDLVDVDLSQMPSLLEPRLRRPIRFHQPPCLLSGRSYFTVMTPQLQSMTVGVEKESEFLKYVDIPNVLPWLPGVETMKIHPYADPVSWLGRADADYRVTTSGLFREPYAMDPNGRGVSDIGMSVWTTKNFTASWDAVTERAPLHAKLTYPGRKADVSRVRVQGTLKNQTPVDLCDVWVMYDNYAFPVPDGLPSGETVTLALGLGQGTLRIPAWMDAPDPVADASLEGIRPETTSILKSLMFHDLRQERGGSAGLFRPLDWSWRIRPAPTGEDRSQREAILIARAKSVRGKIEDVYARNQSPTRIWLGKLPGHDSKPEDRPRLEGQLTQELYFRFLLPIAPEDK